MSNDARCTRRRLLQVAGGATVVGLAGCTGLQTGDGGSQPTDDHDDGEDDHQEGEDDHDGGEDDHQEGEDDHNEGEEDHQEGEDDHDGGAGHDDEAHGHGTVGEPTETAEVAVNTTDDGEAHFRPHVTRVEHGGTVNWVLESGVHTATAYHPANDQPQLVPDDADSWASGTLSEEGETFEHTFETDGVYHYYCAPHETGGMIGSVIVGEPEAHGQPALEDPPEDKPATVRQKLEELNEMCNEALGHEH